MAKDLTTCKPSSGLIKFAIPLILGQVFQQLYNLVDSIVVGNYVGSNALAAVGASASITLLFICIAIGGSLGAGVVISQMFGAKQYGRMKTAICTIVITFFAAGIVLTALGLGLRVPLLKLMNTPANVFDDAELYLRIYFYGFLFMMVYNIFNAVFNAIGDSRTPLIFLAASSVLNIFLNIYFVTKLGMGVDGVAWATVITQGLAVIFTGVVLLKKMKAMKIEEPYSKFDLPILKTMCRIAIPSVIQQSIVSVGLVCLQSVINGFGSVAMAGYTAAGKIDTLAILPMSNMGNAVSTFTAQNIGARKPERVGQGLKAGIIAVTVTALVIALLLFIFGEGLVSLFVNGEDAQPVIDEGAAYLRITGSLYFLFGILNCCAGLLRGAGDMKAFLSVCLMNFGMRVLVSYLVAAKVGLFMVAWATAIGWFCGMILGAILVKSGRWKTKRLV